MGDHESEVKGGDAERTFKLPNPVYFLPYQRHHRFEQGDDELQEILQVHGANYLSASDVGQRPLTPIAVWIVDVCSGSSMYVSGGFMPGCRLNKRCRPIRGGTVPKACDCPTVGTPTLRVDSFGFLDIGRRRVDRVCPTQEQNDPPERERLAHISTTTAPTAVLFANLQSHVALSAGTRLGPYEILSPVGAGGMGEVYEARDTRLDRMVAIKILPTAVAGDPGRRERFQREARAISALTHPHICTLYDIGEADGTDFLVMEHLSGETLARRLLRGPPLADLLQIGAQVADALDAAHARDIVHRDIKRQIFSSPGAARRR